MTGRTALRRILPLGGLILGLGAAATLVAWHAARQQRAASIDRTVRIVSDLCRPMFPEPIAQRTACLAAEPPPRATAAPDSNPSPANGPSGANSLGAALGR